MPKKVDLTGKRFGRLTAIKETTTNKEEKPKWLCSCECGKLTTVMKTHLVSGHTISCGCYSFERSFTSNRQHGHSINGKTSSEYNSWISMKERCHNPNHPQFKYWGGKGIIVCERWRFSFENFINDMGRKPSQKHSVDRFPNQNGNYEPSNCRWATPKEQQNNRTNNRWLSTNGVTKTLTEWASIFGVTVSVLHGHLKSGKSISEMVIYYSHKKSIRL